MARAPPVLGASLLCWVQLPAPDPAALDGDPPTAPPRHPHPTRPDPSASQVPGCPPPSLSHAPKLLSLSSPAFTAAPESRAPRLASHLARAAAAAPPLPQRSRLAGRLFPQPLAPPPRRPRTNQRSPRSLTNHAPPPQPILPRAAVSDVRGCGLKSNYPDGKPEPAHVTSQWERRAAGAAGNGACTC